jgi:hypothetical protein
MGKKWLFMKNEYQRGPPMVISENGIFLFMGIFWDLWEKWYLFLWFWYYF